nr:hypothetical protein BaRGS_033634 [Batillaria attramentaria]
MIDREAVCEFQEECLIKFDVTVSSEQTAFLRIVNVAINITDVNDNVPTFPRDNITLDIPEGTQRSYSYSVVENAPPNMTIGRVYATDLDAGMNARITYSFSEQTRSKLQELFAIDPDRGEIKIIKPLQFVSGNEFNAIVEAKDNGFPAQQTQAQLNITILDVGNNAPQVEFVPKNPLTARPPSWYTILDKNDNAPELETKEFHIVEGNEPDRYVGKLKAHDADVGINAEVEFYMKVATPLPPFIVYPDGQIRTRQNMDIDRELQDRYQFEVYMNDKGSPKQSSSAMVTVHILDVNDNSPEVIFPTSKNGTVRIMWDQKPRVPFAQIYASDPDDGMNSKLYFFIAGSNKNNLFEVDKDRGLVSLSRYIQANDNFFQRVKIAVQDQGNPQLETQAQLIVRIDTTNATFARHDMPAEMEKNILIAGIVGGATIVISIVILVVIFLVRSATRRPRPVKHNLARDWQRDKMGIQEECGKTEMEKVAWKASHGGKALPDPEDVDDDPDICDGPSDHVTMGKVVSLPWSNEKGGGGGSDGHVMHGPLDQYRKQDFYTFCKA